MVTSPIFISYASIDQDVAEAICDALHKRGLRCWISSRDIGPGENFQESIVAAIKSARVMVLVFTGNANNSDEIKKEIALAGHHHVAVIPVRVEDVVPSDALAYEFATRQWVDLFKDWERQIGRLAAQIKSINAAPPFQPAGGEAKSTAPVQLTTKRRRWPIAALSLLTTVAVAGVALILYHQALPIPWAASRHPAPPPLSSSAVTEPLAATAPPTAPSQAEKTAATPRMPLTIAPPPVQPQTKAAPAAESSSAQETAKTVPASQPEKSAAVPQKSPPKPPTFVTASSFEGTWLTTISCDSFQGSPAVKFQITGLVKGGAFHSQRGVEGEPGWLKLDGKIQPNGTTDLYADGIIGRSGYGPKPKGAPYFYRVVTRFTEKSGSGHKVGHRRACTYTFEKITP